MRILRKNGMIDWGVSHGLQPIQNLLPHVIHLLNNQYTLLIHSFTLSLKLLDTKLNGCF